MLVLVALLSGCAHVAPECNAHDATPWTELSSAHFVVRTNLPQEQARAASVQLERARASVLATFPSSGAVSDPLDVVVFTTPAQLQDLTGDPLMEAQLAHDWRGTMLLTASSVTFLEANQLRRTLHELAHHYSARSLKRWPRWFEEGLAIYVETIELDDTKKTATRGAANQLKLTEVMKWGILPVKSLWAWGVEPDPNAGLEQHRAASAWFWVHFLFNEHKPQLDRFLRFLAEGDEPKEAWAAAFGTISEQKMSEEADAYIVKQQARSHVMDLTQLNTSSTERVMGDAEVHALLARVAGSVGAWPRARKEAKTASSLDPRDPRAQEQNVITQETAEGRVEAARVLTQEDAQDPAGWLLLGLSLPQTDPERGQALALASELDPKSPFALTELAAFRCAEARCPEGVQLAEKAAALAPGDARIQANTAAVQKQAGLCTQAVVSQQRALEVLPQRASAGLRKQLQAKLEDYRKCAPR